jgi:hypothetical protein
MVYQVRLFFEKGAEEPVEVVEIDVDCDLDAVRKADEIAEVFGARYALVDRKRNAYASKS